MPSHTHTPRKISSQQSSHSVTPSRALSRFSPSSSWQSGRVMTRDYDNRYRPSPPPSTSLFIFLSLLRLPALAPLISLRSRVLGLICGLLCEAREAPRDDISPPLSGARGLGCVLWRSSFLLRMREKKTKGDEGERDRFSGGFSLALTLYSALFITERAVSLDLAVTLPYSLIKARATPVH